MMKRGCLEATVIGTVVAGLLGMGLWLCRDRPPEYAVPEAASQYRAPVYSAEREMMQSQVTGNIVQVQPGEVSYVGKWDCAGYSGTKPSADHEFIYVIVEDRTGEDKVLIYPQTKAIVEGREAAVRYEATGGMITAEDLLQKYVSPELRTVDNVVIECDGVIVPQGVQYTGG